MRYLVLTLSMFVIFSGFAFSDAFATVTIVPDSGSGSSTDSCVNSQYGCYSPGMAIVSIGETVNFSNTDSAAHTFTAGNPDIGATGEFDTSMIMSGGSYQWTFLVSGDIPYFCMVHPWMDGLIRVVSAEIRNITRNEESPLI